MTKNVLPLIILFASLVSASPVAADDLEIFGATKAAVPSNVLIIYDNSGSMHNCPGTNNSSNAKCNENVKMKIVRDALLAIVQSEQAKDLRLGLMSFVKSSGGEGGRIHLPVGATQLDLQEKIIFIAGDAGEGVPLPKPQNPDQDDPLYIADNRYPYNSGTGTPLAEALAEAGLYFAGKKSAYQLDWPEESFYRSTEQATIDGVNGEVWYENDKYVSPITASCQKNYVVYLTDGEPRHDDPIANPYIAGMPSLVDRAIGVAGQRLDDVAAYLYENDFSSEIGRQNIETIVIGFDIDPNSTQTEEEKKNYQEALALMQQAARDGNGGQEGNFYTVNGVDTETIKNDLIEAFTEIFHNIISESNAIYATPSIPRNPENQVDSGDRAYMAFFKPQPDGRWIGNLKAYGFEDGTLMDSRSTPATALTATDADGLIKDTARSYWDVDAANDGLEVAKGGAGEVLTERIREKGVADRNVYTYTGAGFSRLSQQQNHFKTTNVQGLDTLLESIYPVTIDPDTLINKVVNGTTYTFDDGTTTSWYLGDIVHSEPLVENFSDDCNADGVANDDYVFVGANDGMLHAFCAENGEEMWAFIPPSQLGRLNLLGNGEHHYFVDGSPVIEEIEVPNKPLEYQKILIFGEGRGGQRYIALDFTASDDPTDPHWRYQIHESVLNDSAAVLGQAWAKPQMKTIRDVDNITEAESYYDVFLLAGGYDSRYETANFPASTPQDPEVKGRAIYTVNASSGNVIGLNANGGNWDDMQHSIVEVTGFDAADLGYMDRVYAGDLGGNMLAAAYNAETDYWERLVLLTIPDSLVFEDSLGNAINDKNGIPIAGAIGKKIMTRPEITLETDGECVYFGTGDREHLLEENVTDVFYAVCHNWEKQIDPDTNQPKIENGQYVYEPVYPADTNGDGTVDSSDLLLNDILVDVTDNLVQDSSDATERATIESSLKNNSGWYIRMEHAGEKITSAPKIIDGKVFFTTFTPGQDTQQNTDPCSTTFDLGVSRLYAVDYRNGASVQEFDNNSGLSKDDRSTIIGTSIAYEPVLTTSGLKTTLLYGSGGKLIPQDVSLRTILKRYYWRQIK